jgi:hypothetical protein
MQNLCGWKYQPEHIERVVACLSTPHFQTPEPTQDDVFNHSIFKKFTGEWPQPGPQEIGDCTSWGWVHGVDFTVVLEAYLQIQNQSDPDAAYEYQPTCTEALYAAERINIGNGQMGREDGGVGAWCAKAVMDVGTVSRPNLDSLGLGGTYSGDRARTWGRSGMPQNVLTACTPHTVADTTLVKSFNEAAWHLQQHRVVPVCSDVGFENGPGGITLRDSEGFATRRHSWSHCMCFISVRMGKRPGLLLLNQWPKGATQGPMGPVEIPDCSWWVDADTCDEMLSQGDSFTLSKYKGYPARKLTWRF